MRIAREPRRRPPWRWAAAIIVVAALVVSGLVFTASRVGTPVVLDADSDGLSNLAETSGWSTQDGSVFVTDPINPDSDGDGLSDGEEAGALVTNAQSVTSYFGVSNPRLTDSDEDTVGDADEYFLDMDPKSRDSDSDGLDDNLELEVDSDPTSANPDGDSYTDKEEYDRGSDPLEYTLTRVQSVAATAAGGAFGDCDSCARKAGIRDEQIQSTEYLTGHIASGASGFGDVRDLGVDLFKRDYRAAALSAFGLVAVAGGSVKTVAVLKKFAKGGDRSARAVRVVVERLPLSKTAKKKILDKVFGTGKLLPAKLIGGPKTCIVYAARSPSGSVVYVGITSNIARRQKQHGGRFIITPIKAAKGLSRGACRAIEQALISRGGLESQGGKLANKINSISTKHDDFADALAYGENWLRRKAPEMLQVRFGSA